MNVLVFLGRTLLLFPHEHAVITQYGQIAFRQSGYIDGRFPIIARRNGTGRKYAAIIVSAAVGIPGFGIFIKRGIKRVAINRKGISPPGMN